MDNWDIYLSTRKRYTKPNRCNYQLSIVNCPLIFFIFTADYQSLYLLRK